MKQRLIPGSLCMVEQNDRFPAVSATLWSPKGTFHHGELVLVLCPAQTYHHWCFNSTLVLMTSKETVFLGEIVNDYLTVVK